MTVSVGIVANPYSGRDVRRLAARAANITNAFKQDAVARIATGLDAAGIDCIHVLEEPFRISTGALEHMPLTARIDPIPAHRTHSATDTIEAVRTMVERGCETFVVLGGDGTSRAVSYAAPDATLIPIATGTNNVFPQHVEATSAGLAAGLSALGVLPESVRQRCKRVCLQRDPAGEIVDAALIDVVHLRDDFIGNHMPFDAGRMLAVVLARAEAAAVGTSPIGGFLEPVAADEPGGVHVVLGTGPDTRRALVPLAPGLFDVIGIESVHRLADSETVRLERPGILALDGDRLHKVAPEQPMFASVRRNGPRVVDVRAALDHAAREGRLGSVPAVIQNQRLLGTTP